MIVIDSIISLASNVAGAVKEFLGIQSKKLDLKNTAKMEQAQENVNEVKAVDTTEKAIANKDADEIRKELGE